MSASRVRLVTSTAAPDCSSTTPAILARLAAASEAAAQGLDHGLDQPAFFGPLARPLFGCWHPPAPGVVRRDVAVVLCAPHGAEEHGTHAALRCLALRLADQGSPVLRFDMDGCGDSAGDDLDPGRVQAWLSSIEAAIAAARDASGCRHVALVGVQLGALLSAQVLRRYPEVVLWVGIAPPVSGRQFLRERLAFGALQAPTGSATGGALLEAGGVPYSRTTREGLSTMGLEALTAAPATTQLVLLQRDDLPLPERVRGELPKRLSLRTFSGYADMVREPHHSVVPGELIEAVCAAVTGVSRPAPDAAATLLAWPFGRAEASWDGLVEVPVTVGRAGLRGILSLPSREPVQRTLLLLNAGAIRRVGPSRLYTQLARRWAGRGVAVLRLDLSGLGDSPARPGAQAQTVYGVHAVEEARLAATWLAQITGVDDTTVMGLCSGAVHAFQAVLTGAPAAQLVALNPLVFHHEPGRPVPVGEGAHAAAAIDRAVQQGWRKAAAWQRLLSGQWPLHRVAGLLRRWAVARLRRRGEQLMRLGCRLVGRARPDDLPHALRCLAMHDVAQHFIFAAGEPGAALMEREAGRWVSRLEQAGLLCRHVIPDADHTFTSAAARLRLAEWLDGIVPPPIEPAEGLASPSRVPVPTPALALAEA